MNNILEIIKIVIGSILVLFIPGYFVSLIFMKRGTIDIIERVALSFALSIAVVPLLAFYLNLVGVKINRLSIIIEILAIVLISIGILYFTNIYKKRKQNDQEI